MVAAIKKGTKAFKDVKKLKRSDKASVVGSAPAAERTPTTAPRPAPAFLSALKEDEVDFPRGGGSSLTALELKQTRDEGRREADAEAQAGRAGKKRKAGDDRRTKRVKTSAADEQRKEREKDTIRVEELSYKRLIPGTRVLTRVHTILPLHLILSLPNNLLAHVPITEISSTLTTLLSAEEESDEDEAESSTSASSSPPDLAQLFSPGQYFPAKVINTYPTASQSFISQYPVSETTRLAARTEVSLMPEKVSSDVVAEDLRTGYQISGEVLSEEDNGWRIGLGLSADGSGAGLEGWIGKDGQSTPLLVGQLVPCTVKQTVGKGRIIQLSSDHSTLVKSQLHEVSDVGSVIPGQMTSVLVTAVVPTGLNVKVCGFFDGTIDLAHLALRGEAIDEKYKIGKKIRARVIYDQITATPRHFSLSVLSHVLALSSPTSGDGRPLEQAIEIGTLYEDVTITRVRAEWGALCQTSDGLDGFVHISHISDDRIPVLSGSAGEYKVGSKHHARVIGHSPLDGVLLLSFEKKVLDQVFMQVGELQVGQILKGTIRRLTDKGMFIDIHGSVDGVVWPLHYADIRLKHPEKRFKVDATVRARVFALESQRNRVVLTLKKTLVESELKTPTDSADVATGDITTAVVSKIMDKGCIVDLFGGSRAFVPLSEASQSFTTDLSELFYVGKPVNVKITEIDTLSGRMIASVRQALPSSLSADKIELGDTVNGLVAAVHPEQVLITLQPSQLNALLSLSNLSHHRALTIDQLRSSLKPGDRIDDLMVVSKNSANGLLIVANKKSATKPVPVPSASGVSKPAREIDAFRPGQSVTGQIISLTPQGAMIQLASHLRGRIHPCDAVDDLSLIAGDKLETEFKLDQDVTAYVLSVNRGHRSIELSTRPSRLSTDAPKVIDREINSLDDLKEGAKIRGIVKNVSSHGLFVSLGRDVVARVMIKELFDEYVKDWQARFEQNQFVTGIITSMDKQKKLVEMSLKRNPSKAKTVARLGLSDFSTGQRVIATVKKVESYGLFLQIEGSEVSGLCHRSELSDNKKQDVSKALTGFREGDQVKAVIIEVDTEKRRINFSIKPSWFEDPNEDNDEEDAGEADEGDDTSDDGDDEQAEGGELDLIGLLQDEDDGSNDDDGNSEEDEGSEDEEMGSDEDDEEAHLPPPKVGPSSKPKVTTKSSAPGITIKGGFDWSDAVAASDAESSGSSSDEEATPQKAKAKGKAKASYDLAATSTEAQPESANDFERALLASPNSSFLWIQYMSFLLQLHEIDMARKIGRQALQRIGFREEAEKLNVWMALINVELGFGTSESTEKVFKEAAEYNDKKTVYLRYAEALQESGKEDAVEEQYSKTVKKFSQHPDAWLKFAEWFFKRSRVEDARELLPRSMKSLEKSKHIEIIEKFAILEFKHGDAERGKTLFEELVDRYKRRLDLWSVYIDQLASTGDIQGVRGLFDRALDQKLTSKKAKFLFKKWLAIENRIGDEGGQEKAKDRAREWVAANAQANDDEED